MTAKKRMAVAWRLLRPFTLAASVVPALTGIVLAAGMGPLKWDVAAAFVIACILIQSATNMFNEYFDYRRGLDTKEMVGIAGTIVRDGVSPGVVLATGWVFITVAILLGLYISARSSWWVFAAGLASIGVAYLYSGGPVPLSYTPFGELAAGAFMGPGIIALVVFSLTGAVPARAWWVSIPVGLLIGSILFANNLRDIDQDRQGGRHTLAIVLGRDRARRFLGAVFTAAFVLVLTLAAFGWLTPWTALTMLAVPQAVRVLQRFARFTRPADLHPAVKGTAQLLMAFGVLLQVGLLLSY